MIRAIFFGSNDLVSGSVVAVQEKIYHELTACSFKEIAFVITLTKTFNLVHLEPLTNINKKSAHKLPRNEAMKSASLNYQFHESARLHPQDRFFAKFSLS